MTPTRGHFYKRNPKVVLGKTRGARQPTHPHQAGLDTSGLNHTMQRSTSSPGTAKGST